MNKQSQFPDLLQHEFWWGEIDDKPKSITHRMSNNISVMEKMNQETGYEGFGVVEFEILKCV